MYDTRGSIIWNRKLFLRFTNSHTETLAPQDCRGPDVHCWLLLVISSIEGVTGRRPYCSHVTQLRYNNHIPGLNTTYVHNVSGIWGACARAQTGSESGRAVAHHSIRRIEVLFGDFFETDTSEGAWCIKLVEKMTPESCYTLQATNDFYRAR